MIKNKIKHKAVDYRQLGVIDEPRSRSNAVADSPNTQTGQVIVEHDYQRDFPAPKEVLPVEDGGYELLENAYIVEREQQALIETLAPIDEVYQETLSVYVDAKHRQVDRIEDNIERMIDQQQSRLQQNKQPGLLSSPSSKRAWQSQQVKQQARLQMLHTRLEIVREIANDMGIYAPRVEELAHRKMRTHEPELVVVWDGIQAAKRHNEALSRMQEKENKMKQTGGITLGVQSPR
jgi:hypothetical protein